MSKELEKVLEANAAYVKEYRPATLSVVPQKKLTIVTCMDARLDPAAFLGLNLSDANVIRNAGASTVEAARSVLLSNHLLGTREVLVVKHTDCGMLGAKPELVRSAMKQNLQVKESKLIDDLEIRFIENLAASCRSDVAYLREHALALKDVHVTGWIYHTETGELRQLVA